MSLSDKINTSNLTPDEVRVLKAALENYTHVLMGQADVALDPCIARAGARGNLSMRNHHRVTDLLIEVREILTGSETAKTEPSIGNDCISNDARIARRLNGGLNDETIVFKLYNRDGTTRHGFEGLKPK